MLIHVSFLRSSLEGEELIMQVHLPICRSPQCDLKNSMRCPFALKYFCNPIQSCYPHSSRVMTFSLETMWIVEYSGVCWSSLNSVIWWLENDHNGSICTMEMTNATNLGSTPHILWPVYQISEYIPWKGGQCGMKPFYSNTWALIIAQQSYFISLVKKSLKSQGVGSERMR